MNEREVAYLVRLNALILDVINGSISEDTVDELRALQPHLRQIIGKSKATAAEKAVQKKKALATANQSNARAKPHHIKRTGLL